MTEKYDSSYSYEYFQNSSYFYLGNWKNVKGKTILPSWLKKVALFHISVFNKYLRTKTSPAAYTRKGQKGVKS